jgi:hypothetical protein
MRDEDERPTQADENYDKPEVEDLDADGPSETAAGLTATNGSTG